MSPTAVFRQLVRDHMSPPPVVLDGAATCAEATTEMARAAVDCVLITGPGETLAGIITEQDVARRIAFRHPAETPLATVMTSPVRTIRARDYLYRAIATMRRAHLRHMPVVDDHGRAVGMLALHDALAAAAAGLIGLIERLTHEETVDGLKAVKAAQVEVAEALYADGVPAPEIQGLLADINLDLYRRIVDRTTAEMEAAGWGPPPVPFAVLVMGSGGRGESFLFPDQDNGFVLEDYPDAEHTRIDAFYIALAERMTATLDAVGFPLCRGNVMATNPVWRKSLSQWRAQIAIWMRRRSLVALRLADIFFDFRTAAGAYPLGEALRDYITGMLARNPVFLREMYDLQADHRVALGLFGRLLTTRENGVEVIDLKYHGTLPLVEAVRLLALRKGVRETSTLGRIAALRGRGVLDANEEDYLGGAFRLVTDLLLRQQIADFRAGRKVGNQVPVAALSERERDMLVDCFRAVTGFRERVRGELTGEVF